MRKSLVAIMAVAIIGALGVYTKGSGNPASAAGNTPAQTTSVSAANTTNTSDQASAGASSPSSSGGTYKDGTYSGRDESTEYGDVQIAVVVSGGKIVNINFLRMPSDEGHSREVTAFAEPLLKQTTIKSQNSNIDFVSGATTTSEAYQMSLQYALNQAA